MIASTPPSGGGRDLARGEVALGVLGKVLAAPGALFDLGLGLGDRLSHLDGHEAGEAVAVLAQDAGHGDQYRRALGERGAAPGGEGGGGALEAALDLGRVVLGILGDRLAGSGVHGAHGWKVADPGLLRVGVSRAGHPRSNPSTGPGRDR